MTTIYTFFFVNFYVHMQVLWQFNLIRAVTGQRSSPDFCFATKSIKIDDP